MSLCLISVKITAAVIKERTKELTYDQIQTEQKYDDTAISYAEP